jgi:hypothetical protein
VYCAFWHDAKPAVHPAPLQLFIKVYSVVFFITAWNELDVKLIYFILKITTHTTEETSALAYKVAAALCVLGCLCCVCIPLLSENLK